MHQEIAGTAIPEAGEVTIMTVWPSVARFALGRLLGRIYAIRLGIGGVLTVGHLAALATIPIALVLYFARIMPLIGVRYRLTNHRVLVERGLSLTVERWVALDDFDSIEVEVLPGQEWYRAGQLIFRKGQVETFRLSGVSRPDVFRHTCLAAHQAYVSVQRLVAAQRAAAV